MRLTVQLKVKMATGFCKSKTVTVNPGVRGNDAAPYTGGIPAGKNGQPGAVFTGTRSYGEVASLVDDEYIDLLLHSAEIEFLNSENSISASRLVWVFNLLTGALSASPADTILATQRLNQLLRAQVLLRYMSLGLDYFGNPNNHAFLLTVGFYESSVNQLLQYAEKIEDQYAIFHNKSQSDAARIDALEEVRKATIDHTVVLQAQQTELINERPVLESRIESLTALVAELRGKLFAAETAAQDAIAGQSKGCGFVELVTIVGSIVTLVETGGTTFTSIGPMLAAMQSGGTVGPGGKAIPKGLDSFKYEIKTILAVGNSFGDFAKAGQDLLDKLKGTSSPLGGLPSDTAKIIATADQVQQQLQPYLNLNAVRKYAELIQTFVAVAESRNNKILEYNCNRIMEQEIRAKVVALKLDSDKLTTNIAIKVGGKVAGATVFMKKAYLNAKASVVRALYEMDRSQRFYTLRQSQKFSVNDLSVAALTSAKIQLATSYRAALVEFGVGPAKYNVSLLLDLDKGSLDQFIKNGSLVFSLPPSCPEFKGYCHVLAQAIGVEFPGLKKNTAFHAVFKHLGSSPILDRSGKTHVFSHQVVPASYHVDSEGIVLSSGQLAGSVDGSPNSNYVGVSPFGPWLLELDGISPTNRKSIKKVRIFFDTLARPI